MAKRYYGVDDRRVIEEVDGNMVSSGKGEFANLPQKVVMRAYPKAAGDMPENLNDSISGVDAQMKADNGKKMKNLQKEKV